MQLAIGQDHCLTCSDANETDQHHHEKENVEQKPDYRQYQPTERISVKVYRAFHGGTSETGVSWARAGRRWRGVVLEDQSRYGGYHPKAATKRGT
ncbi:peptidase M3, neutral zinc metallopeptidase, Zn-binding site [Anopheles sinensis]|uniref:Peptidase M3, neutral zinc metallopeptidase, Zn-binding site n=1 Tax=Anopheles sinensis TaxID=74873 RepID=A0A084VE95_ANOSI|nr:peptidase M3, neutral zinc metallopeptidase, Zn-binding site [Anopheles sinensis]